MRQIPCQLMQSRRMRSKSFGARDLNRWRMRRCRLSMETCQERWWDVPVIDFSGIPERDVSADGTWRVINTVVAWYERGLLDTDAPLQYPRAFVSSAKTSKLQALRIYCSCSSCGAVRLEPKLAVEAFGHLYRVTQSQAHTCKINTRRNSLSS